MTRKILVLIIILSLIIGGTLVAVRSERVDGGEDVRKNFDSEPELGGLADSAWPSFGRDKKNTGLSPYDTSHIDGAEKWNFETGEPVRSSPSIGDDGTIYVGSVDNNFYAINPNGTEKWSFETGDNIQSSPAIGDDGTIYFGSNDNNLYALNPNGTEKWNFTTEDFVKSSPTIGDDGTVYFASNDNHLYALNPNGTKKWSFNPIYDCDHSPAIGDDGTIYFGSGLEEPELFAIHPNGTEKWSFDPDFGGTMTSSPTIADDGTIYYGSVDENLYAVTPNGTEKWNFKTEGSVRSSPAIDSNGTIYFGSDDKNLYALNPNGTEKWNFETDWYFRSPPAIGSDGTIYVGCYDDNLYALNPNGTEKWSFETEFHIGVSPAIGEDGTIYVGSFDNNLYAIGPEEYDLLFLIEDQDGDPIENATVEVSFNSYAMENITDANGEALFEDLEPETYEYEVTHDNYETENGEVEIVDKDVKETVVMEETVMTYDLTFEVEDEDGDPIENATVEVSFNSYAMENTTDANGEALFEDLEPETYEYEVTHDNYETENGEVEIIDQEKTETVIMEEKDGDDGGIPGFTTMLLLLASVIAVAIYRKKSRK
ncbi:MAG: PQQ-binding-like beta-propeller repeat protein [Candidatus Thermoplasmatota archaeon]|nr:PQQ-binding-like beta-propeller repeat protein [Candidatus Thermoplasmatota archaeon]